MSTLWDSGAPASNEYSANGCFRNGTPVVEILEIYNQFAIDPMDAPYGWSITGLSGDFYIDSTLAATITSAYVCIRKLVAEGQAGTVLLETTVSATLTEIQPANGNSVPLYTVSVTIPAFHLFDYTATVPGLYWVTITPLVEDIYDYGFTCNLAHTATPPAVCTSFYYGSGWVDDFVIFNYNYALISDILAEIVGFAFRVFGDVFIPPPGICDGPNPPAYCSTEYPAICSIANPPAGCLPPPGPPLPPPTPPPSPPSEPPVIAAAIPTLLRSGLRVQRVSGGFWKPL